MSKHLGADHLTLVWKGTIEPLLKEYFLTEPDRLSEFHLDKFQTLIEDAVAVDDASEEEDEVGQAKALAALPSPCQHIVSIPGH